MILALKKYTILWQTTQLSKKQYKWQTNNTNGRQTEHYPSHWDISSRFYSNDCFHWLYHFTIFDSFYKKVLKLPNFYPSNSWSEHKLHEWLQKVATRGHFKPKITKIRIKTVIFPLSRRVQGRDGCQNFINLSQNSNFMVWCSTIQSGRS